MKDHSGKLFLRYQGDFVALPLLSKPALDRPLIRIENNEQHGSKRWEKYKKYVSAAVCSSDIEE